MIFPSAEQELLRGIMSNLLQSKLNTLLNGEIHDRVTENIGVDGNGNKIPKFSYIVVGESDATETRGTNAYTESISVTVHAYHRNNEKPYLATDSTRQLLRDVVYFLEEKPLLPNARVIHIKKEMQQVFTDIDRETMHGVVRMNYTVVHNVRYKNKEMI